ncbi:GTP-binding protein [Bacterioplanes sanyensis]|uniref:GTP-binding protein n=1 Tax=Bacterioplanes sanyensis TaxID=1249553 RepID=A0A222FIR6_9GAMM|nr:GTP-binding protein [Bacterioplanes sanyensis]ASP38311.1 GTP-binding protein [Bacterioplanes sanyensis]
MARVRTHLITGFLGVGKTTAILHLLQHKPADEKWAVLVNEFGEVGVDGAILAGQGAVVREVPGGCLCCVSGLPFQMGLNWLISREQPDVLLIEPTGLGHPRQVLETLRNEHYQDVLELGANVCLVDPRHLSQPRYLEHQAFIDQLQLADVVVANKTDFATDADRQCFDDFIARSQPAKAASEWLTHGQLEPQLLLLPVDADRLAIHPHAHAHESPATDVQAPLALAPGEPWRRFSNQGQGHFSVGWLFNEQQQFSLDGLRDWVAQLDVVRLKALLLTDQGPMVINMRDGIASEMPTRALDESRLEIIADQPLDEAQLEQQLLALIGHRQ